MKANEMRAARRDAAGQDHARGFLLLLTAVLILALAGCSSPADPLADVDDQAGLVPDEADNDRNAVPPAPARLEGKTWHLRSVRGSAVPADVTITATFADGRVTGRAGCNEYSAAYAAVDGAITFGRLAATKMMCSDEAMFWENQFRIHLEEAVLFDIQDGRLLLIRRDDTALAFALSARDIGDLRREEDVDERGLDR